MHYRYFEELTAQIEHLRARLGKRQNLLTFRGLDLSHAFARQLYFAAAGDSALQNLWARTPDRALPAASISSPALALLARDWFGTTIPARLRVRAALAPARLWLGRGGAQSPPNPGATAPILLFAHSLRFARFLAPLARQLGPDAAYLMAAGDEAARKWAAGQGLAVRLYHPAPSRLRHAGGILARYAPGLALLAEEIEEALKGSNARVIVVPEGNAPIDEIVGQVGRRRKIAVACLQQGWSPLIHTGFRNMRYDRMLVWGKGFSDLLAPFNPCQIFEPVGNFNLPPNPFGKDRPHGVGFFCQGRGGWTCLEDEARMIDLACDVANALPQLPVFVRAHPLEPFDAVTRARLVAVPNIQISDPHAHPFAEMMSAISVGVSIYSSSLLECAASGVVPVVFNITSMPRYMPDLESMGAGIEVHTYDAARDALENLLSAPDQAAAFAPYLSAFQAQFFANQSDTALNAICIALQRLLGGIPDISPACYLE